MYKTLPRAKMINIATVLPGLDQFQPPALGTPSYFQLFNLGSEERIFTMKSLISEDKEYRKGSIVWGFAFVFMVLLGTFLRLSFSTDSLPVSFLIPYKLEVVGIYGALEPVNEAAGSQKPVLLSKRNYAVTARKLLTNSTSVSKEDDDGDGGGDNGNGDGSTNRVGIGSPCSKDNILVFQGATSPLPNGIPTYTVEIQNACLSESCSISDIHLSCGWFSSARLINPRIFRRIEYDDCLVNDGEPLNPGEALSFQYANTFKYPLSVSSVSC